MTHPLPPDARAALVREEIRNALVEVLGTSEAGIGRLAMALGVVPPSGVPDNDWKNLEERIAAHLVALQRDTGCEEVTEQIVLDVFNETLYRQETRVVDGEVYVRRFDVQVAINAGVRAAMPSTPTEGQRDGT